MAATRPDLHAEVHHRFRKAFGEPTNSLGQADQWSLYPVPGALSITIFLNGPIDATAVWMLDPHDKKEEVEKASILNLGEVDHVIARVKARVKRAERRLRMKDDAPRFTIFIEALQSWCSASATGQEQYAQVQLKKLALAGALIADHPDFIAQYLRFAKQVEVKDPEIALNCLTAFLNALSSISHAPSGEARRR